MGQVSPLRHHHFWHDAGMPRSGEPTRQKILDAAEQVIAEVGVDAATFAEINSRASQRNNSATQYHFGDRVALLEAVIARHTSAIRVKRDEYLDSLPADATLADFVRSLVEPLGTCLDHEPGRRYLIIQASLLSHPDRDTWPDSLVRPWTRPGVDRIVEQVETTVEGPEPAPTADLKREIVSLLLFHSMANRARRAGPDADHSEFLHALFCSVLAVIESDFGR